jgi:N-acyl homoserine lactone hydrolase
MKDLVIRPIPLYIGPMQTSKFTYMMNWQDLTSIAGYVWYIEGAKKRILVDSGITIEGMLAMGSPRREKPQEMVDGLAKVGVKPEDIDIVIETHLDRDHIELAYKFTNAKFIVQKKELEFALNPHPALAGRFFPKEFYKNVNFEVIEGDQPIVDGVEVLFTPGHSPGTQSVAVETAKGKAIITGFCCSDMNMFPPPEVAKVMPVITLNIHTDLFACYDSMVRVKELADIIVALHEPRYCWVDRIP